jgi:septum formation inhibitor MinC
MAVDFNDKRFRSDFKAERDRILAAIRDCEALDKDLNETVTELKKSMQRVRGAASLVVRMTEQIISNRNLRLSLIKELRALKRDVIEREIKLAEKEGEQSATAGAAGVTAALLAHLQSVILTPGSNTSTLEPPPETAAVVAPAEKSEEEVAEELELPDEIRPGDIVSDPEGNLWVIGDDGAEETGLLAAECYPEPDEGVPYAILEDGRTVLVVDIG